MVHVSRTKMFLLLHSVLYIYQVIYTHTLHFNDQAGIHTPPLLNFKLLQGTLLLQLLPSAIKLCVLMEHTVFQL